MKLFLLFFPFFFSFFRYTSTLKIQRYPLFRTLAYLFACFTAYKNRCHDTIYTMIKQVYEASIDFGEAKRRGYGVFLA